MRSISTTAAAPSLMPEAFPGVTEPSFLKASVEPHREADLATPGLYDMVVEVPADAPVCQFMGNPQGSVRIVTAHPRVPEIKLNVLLSVTP